MRKISIGVRLDEDMVKWLRHQCAKEYGLTMSTLIYRLIRKEIENVKNQQND